MGVRKRYSVVAVACLFLFASLAGCLDDNPVIDDEPSGEVELGEIDVYSVDKNGEKVWQIVMVITDEDFEGTDDVSWEQIHLDMIAPDGYVNGFELWPLNGPIPLEFGAKYIPKDPNSDFVNEGDMIIIHGVGEELEGGSVELFRGSTLLLEMDLPIQFEPDITVTFDDPVMGFIIFPGSTSYTYEAEVTDIDPSNATLNWWTLQLRIESPTDEFADLFGPMVEDPGVEGYDGETGPPQVEFWYIDDPLNGTDGPGIPDAMDEGDSIKITGLSEKYAGADLTLLKGEDPIWTGGSIPEMPASNVSLELDSPIIGHVNRNETAFWNVTIPINEVEPDDLIRWDSIWVRILDSEDNWKIDMEIFRQDPGDYCATISTYWNDDGVQDNIISKGDDIVIKGLNLTYQGGLVEVYLGLTLLDSIRLPSLWPIPDFELIYQQSYLDSNAGVDYWDIIVNITRVDPENIQIPWEDLEARVIDRGTGKILIPKAFLRTFDSGIPEVPTILYYSYEDDDYPTFPGYIYVSALDEVFRGTWLEVFYDGAMVCEVELEGHYRLPGTVMNMANPDVAVYTFTNHTDYRIILNINKITPLNAKIYWTSITIEVVSSTGSILIPKTTLGTDTGSYDEDPSDGIDICLWYIEVTTGDMNASAGDAFKLTGFTTDAEGGTVNIYADGVLIGSVTLPTDFP